MELTDSRDIAADRQTVWNALLDPDVLKDCVPGCQEMSGSVEDGFEAVVVQKVGPVKATFKGQVTLSDMTQPEALTLMGEGNGGKLAQLGSRIIDGFAKKMTDQFFTRFQEVVEGPAEAETELEGAGDTPDDKKGWLKRRFSKS